MNIIHATRRLLGLHPARRVGERNYNSAAEVIEAVRYDLIHGRRHDDGGVAAARAAFAKAEADVKRSNALTAASTKA